MGITYTGHHTTRGVLDSICNHAIKRLCVFSTGIDNQEVILQLLDEALTEGRQLYQTISQLEFFFQWREKSSQRIFHTRSGITIY